MVKPALAATRAAAVLDYLSMRPGRPCTLTEIAGALRVSPASMLAVLAALADAGYLVRHRAHKTYVLGPAVVALGQAAMVQNPVVPAADRELQLLADEIDAQCAASVLMGDELVAVAVAGRTRRPGTWTRVGVRAPFVAPFGVPFAAFGTDSLRRAWRGPHDDGISAELDRALAVVRARGYAVNRDGEARERLGAALGSLGDDPANDRLRREVDSLIALHTEDFLVLNLDKVDSPRDIAHVTVPVFGPDDEVVMILTGGGFARPLGGAEVEAVADRLKASAEAIAFAAFGRVSATRETVRPDPDRVVPSSVKVLGREEHSDAPDAPAAGVRR